MRKIDEIKIQIKRFQLLLVIIWLVNLVLILIPFIQYYNNMFVYDIWFFVMAILNIVSFYFTYLLSDKLKFNKYSFKHFSSLKNSNEIFVEKNSKHN